MSDRIAHPVTVIFDGECNFCNASVNFVIDRDPRAAVRWVPRTSDKGRELIRRFGLTERDYESMVLIERERVSLRSTSALRIAGYMTAPWPLMKFLLCIPQGIRDAVYDFIAANRYRWFGKEAACRLPAPELRARFE